MNKSEEFDKAIAEIVLALEKAGVYDQQLKNCIDQLFLLKDLVLIRDIAASPLDGWCYRCRFFQENQCSKLEIKVENYFRCHYYEFPKPKTNDSGR